MTRHPEAELVGFDLAFASARSALEALCCGCAVIVCDERGLGGLVTAENFSAFRAKNFGLRSFTAPVTAERLIEQIRRYDRADAEAVSRRARSEAALPTLLDAFEKLYAEVLSGPRKPSVSKDAHDAAVAQFLHDYLPRHPSDPRRPWPYGREADANAHLEAAMEEIRALERSRLLRLGRWLRRFTGSRVPH
jgi:hypothetical protein